jgi:hypothetical protein
MGRYLFGCAAASVMAVAVSAAAQNPPPANPAGKSNPADSGRASGYRRRLFDEGSG